VQVDGRSHGAKGWVGVRAEPTRVGGVGAGVWRSRGARGFCAELGRGPRKRLATDGLEFGLQATQETVNAR
jgi:hypothetical protein